MALQWPKIFMAQNIYGPPMAQNIYGPPMAQNIYGSSMAQNALISINEDKYEQQYKSSEA